MTDGWVFVLCLGAIYFCWREIRELRGRCAELNRLAWFWKERAMYNSDGCCGRAWHGRECKSCPVPDPPLSTGSV